MQQRYINDGVVIVQLLISQDEATCDGNGRKKLCPVYATFANIRAAERDFPWARVLVGYIGSPNKNKKPACISQAEWLRHKRTMHQASMVAMLESVRRLAPTGVRIQLPGRDGVWRPMTAIFSLLHAAYDEPESKKVTGVKDKYTDMPMFCIRCAGDIASAA